MSKMKAKITFEIVVSFLLVSLPSSSSHLKGGEHAVCNRTVRPPQLDTTPIPGSVDLRVKQGSNNLLNGLRDDEFRQNEDKSAVLTKEICCPGYEDISGTCTPQCPANCSNGNCSQPNNCTCNFGWEGEFCNEPIYCTIAQPLHPNISQPLETDATENHLIELKKHACHPECYGQNPNTFIKSFQYGNMTYHIILINSPCNTISSSLKFLEEYKYVIGAVIMIIIIALIVITVCIVYTVRKKREQQNTVEHEAVENHYYEYVDLDSICSR